MITKEEAMKALADRVGCDADGYNERNCAKLAVFLWETNIPEEQFQMENYAWDTDLGRPVYPPGAINLVHDCNTAGCAIGWAPTAGIKPDQVGDSNWEGYIENHFMSADVSSYAWKWCFSSHWHDCPKSAAKRIAYMLEFKKHAFVWQNEIDTVTEWLELYEPDWNLIKGMIKDSVTESPSPLEPSLSESSQS